MSVTLATCNNGLLVLPAFNRKSLSIVTEPINTPITLTQVKDWLKIDGTDEDATLTIMMNASIKSMINFLNRPLINTEYLWSLDRFPGDTFISGNMSPRPVDDLLQLDSLNALSLPKIKLKLVDSVKTTDTTNTQTTFDASNYFLDLEGSRIVLNSGAQWPSSLRSKEAIAIQFTSGFGTDAADVPDDIIAALLSDVSNRYECRSACELCKGSKIMVGNYKVRVF